ncbi:transcription termination factor Rho, partial [Jatrophihabitans sp. YIM 134969]
MTDTADRTETLVLPGVDTNGAGAETPARRRSGSLSSMLLPELQQLAGSLGIPTAKKKKSDLVAAIQAHRSGGSNGAGAATTAPTVSAPVASAPAASAPAASAPAASAPAASAPAEAPAATSAPESNAAPRTRTRRGASRPAAAADSSAAAT